MEIETISPKYFTTELKLNTHKIETILSDVFDKLKTSEIWEFKNRKIVSVNVPIGEFLDFDERRVIAKFIKKSGWTKFEVVECYQRIGDVPKQVYLQIDFYFPLSIMDRLRRFLSHN